MLRSSSSRVAWRDLFYYGNQRQLEYDVTVAIGVNAQTITLDFHGVDSPEVDAVGDISLHIEDGQVVQDAPANYEPEAVWKERTQHGDRPI